MGYNIHYIEVLCDSIHLAICGLALAVQKCTFIFNNGKSDHMVVFIDQLQPSLNYLSMQECLGLAVFDKQWGHCAFLTYITL